MILLIQTVNVSQLVITTRHNDATASSVYYVHYTLGLCHDFTVLMDIFVKHT